MALDFAEKRVFCPAPHCTNRWHFPERAKEHLDKSPGCAEDEGAQFALGTARGRETPVFEILRRFAATSAATEGLPFPHKPLTRHTFIDMGPPSATDSDSSRPLSEGGDPRAPTPVPEPGVSRDPDGSEGPEGPEGAEGSEDGPWGSCPGTPDSFNPRPVGEQPFGFEDLEERLAGEIQPYWPEERFGGVVEEQPWPPQAMPIEAPMGAPPEMGGYSLTGWVPLFGVQCWNLASAGTQADGGGNESLERFQLGQEQWPGDGLLCAIDQGYAQGPSPLSAAGQPPSGF